MPNKEDKCGALWEKESAQGRYFSGEIEIDGGKTRMGAFENRFKQQDKHPDWIVYKSVPRGER